MEASTIRAPSVGVERITRLAAYTAVIALALWLTKQSEYIGFYWDDAFYLRMADLFSPWWTGDRSALLGMVRERGYPLLYPALLAGLGGGSERLAWTYAINGMMIGAGWIVIWHWARHALHGRWTAAFLLLIAVVNLQTLQLLNVLLSEHLYVLLSFGCLLTWRKRNEGVLWVALAATLAGLAAATRGIGIALPIALSLVLLIEARAHRLALLALTWAPLLVERLMWSQLGLPSYGSAVTGALPGYSGAEWAGFLQHQAAAIGSAWTNSFAPAPALARIWLIPCAVLALAGLLVQWRRKELEAIYVSGYLVIMVLWPFPTQMGRFLQPVFPLLVLAAVQALALLPWRNAVASARATTVFLGLGAAMVCVTSLGQAFNALRADLPPELESLRRTTEWMSSRNRDGALEVIKARRGWLDDMDVVEASIPSGECVYSELFAVVMARTSKPVALPPWYSLKEASGATARGATARGATARGCGYYYFVPLMLRGGEDLDAVHQFTLQHTLIHRSASPRDPTGRESLGLLLRLQPAAGKQRK